LKIESYNNIINGTSPYLGKKDTISHIEKQKVSYSTEETARMMLLSQEIVFEIF